jgi:hypothetical protein
LLGRLIDHPTASSAPETPAAELFALARRGHAGMQAIAAILEAGPDAALDENHDPSCDRQADADACIAK